MKDNTTKKHFNLYYIFLEDKQRHPPPQEAITLLKTKIAKRFPKPPP